MLNLHFSNFPFMWSLTSQDEFGQHLTFLVTLLNGYKFVLISPVNENK
jgi:hypothetical protein